MDLKQVSESFGNEDRSWPKSRLGFDQCRPITLDLSLFSSAYYAETGYIPTGTPLTFISGTGRYGPLDPPTNEVQTLTEGGSGLTSWIATIPGFGSTPSLDDDATIGQVQDAFEALVGDGNVAVTGTTNPIAMTVNFGVGELAGENIPTITTAPTGGSGTVVVATTTQGDADANSGQKFEGLLFNAVQVKEGNATGRAASALFWMGVVDETRLPFPIPEASKSEVPHIRFEGAA